MMNHEEAAVKILLVDDDERNLLVLEELLHLLPVSFVKATSGKKALKCLLNEDFALILLDVQMPDLDGFETAQIIINREKNKYTPIIFVTAYPPSETYLFKGYAVGAVDYIVKPIVPEILLSKVKVFIQLFQQANTLKKVNEELINTNTALQAEIIERLETERQLQQLTNELKVSNQELEKFAYIASHDLQEPLRTVTSYTQLLAERYQDQLDKKANEYIGYIVNSATHMHQLIKDLLTYSRLGRNELNLKLTDCNLIIHNILVDLKLAIDENSANITWDTLPTIIVDSVKITQLFENLIGNALKYHGQEPPEIHISAIYQENQWLFSIRDNGIGIENQYSEQIFVIFQRLHNAQEYSGTGIGLALCKKIVERHKGRIWIDSELGKGTTFYFTIPIIEYEQT